MYKFSLLNNNLGISTFYHSVNDSAFFIVVEDINWDVSQAKDNSGLKKTIQKAFCIVQDDTTIDNIPMEFANKLDFIIKKLNNEKKSRNSLYFTGISLTKDNIYVCTAGYTRVHLLKDMKIIERTRDHNHASDSVENKKLDINYKDFPPLFHSHTRTLGIEESKPPESLNWKVEGDYSIIICSSLYHRFRNPKEYIELFNSIENSSIIEDGRRISGILAKIEYIKTDYDLA